VAGAGGDAVGGRTAQASSNSSTAAPGSCRDNRSMGLILLEALGALVLLVLIVWWTMFSGRRGGERRDDPPALPGPKPGGHGAGQRPPDDPA